MSSDVPKNLNCAIWVSEDGVEEFCFGPGGAQKAMVNVVGVEGGGCGFEDEVKLFGGVWQVF